MSIFLAVSLIAVLPDTVLAKTGIVQTRHNLSSTGPGEIKALTEKRICIFCHTPHNAAPNTPLWNKDLEAVNYVLYSSSTLAARPSQPSGSSRLCLSCHDGLVALGNVRTPSGGIETTGQITPDRSSWLGTMLSGHHPISFSYYDSLPNPELLSFPPSDLLIYGSGIIQCSTCHDAHDNTYGKFLATNNRNSALCTKCHQMEGWGLSSHRLSAAGWNGVLPNPWPHTGSGTDFNFLTVAENGCENCHVPHDAKGKQRLMSHLLEEDNCYPCHNGNVAFKNIYSQFQKSSRHQVEDTAIDVTGNSHKPKESPLLITGHVECADCHNSHASNQRNAVAPYVSGRNDKVSGVSLSGSALPEAQRQYEICFKCHADSASQTPLVPRVINSNNARLEFSPTNPSFHPVAGTGRNMNVPSIPSAFEPTLSTSSIIYCTACHDSDESPAIGGGGPAGPHGSMYSQLLRERYDTADNTMEGPQNYALCYRCHNRNSILSNASFRPNSAGRGGHSGHLSITVKAPCSACHDPHGVNTTSPMPPAGTGDHTHLINFDIRVVSAAPGNAYPFFSDRGTFAGSCTLTCHGRVHVDETYPMINPASLMKKKFRR